MRIAVLTGGGDVPGLNPCIKAIVTRAEAHGWEAIGFRRGWAGPLRADPRNEGSQREHVMALDGAIVRDIDRTGGTIRFDTDYCIDFGTAVGRSVDFIDASRTPAGSHERIAAVELFGRNSGQTA